MKEREAVGFTARLASDVDYNSDTTVVFNKIVTNIGSHYNSANG